MPIDFGTPQGSTLGPVLFLFYINDIFNLKLNGKIICFADDAVIVYCNSNINELNRLMQEDISTIANWFEANKLTEMKKKQNA